LQTYGDCPALDQLFGSRIAVANAELRLPLFGSYAAIPTRRVPPVEAAVFYDTGAAWRKTEAIPFFQTNSRHLVQSYGTTLRVNILGMAIGEMSYVYPTGSQQRVASGVCFNVWILIGIFKNAAHFQSMPR
jgi:outer membrane protein assembly factor BamA